MNNSSNPSENKITQLYYLPSDQLPFLSEQEVSVHTIRDITNILLENEAFSWDERFNVITQLRRMHKYIPDFFFELFNSVYRKVGLLIDSPTKLSKNVLLLLKELFSQYYDEGTIQYEYIIKYLKYFLPLILKKYCAAGTHKEYCNLCLTEISTNMLYYDTLLILLQTIIDNNKNFTLSEISFEIFYAIYSEFPEPYLADKLPEGLEELMDKINQIHQLKDTVHIKQCYKFLELLLHQHITFEEYINEGLGKNIKNIINNNDTNKQKGKIRSNIASIQRDKINHNFVMNLN